MANNAEKIRAAEDAEKTPSSAEKAEKRTPESVYTAEELADNHKLFGTYREIVVIALRCAGKETATLSEAKSIIEKFKNKEVK